MRASLLVDPANQSLLAAAAVISDGLGRALGEVLERGEALDAVLLAGGLAVRSIAVDLCNVDAGFTLKVLSDLLVCGSEVLAVSAPGLAASHHPH